MSTDWKTFLNLRNKFKTHETYITFKIKMFDKFLIFFFVIEYIFIIFVFENILKNIDILYYVI